MTLIRVSGSDVLVSVSISGSPFEDRTDWVLERESPWEDLPNPGPLFKDIEVRRLMGTFDLCLPMDLPKAKCCLRFIGLATIHSHNIFQIVSVE